MQALQFRFADFLDECLLLLSTKGKIYYANRAALNLLQTTAETIVGQDLTSLLIENAEFFAPPEDHGKFRRQANACRRE